ncbi:MAG: iron-containing redox enzyme family protein [Deltaproteobacteria bacterium]|nr:iron-containing redox enzyme family protein [Deltaproteobacteria bacterium]
MTLVQKYDKILDQMTRDLFETKEVKRFLETRLTRSRAQIISQQFGLFVRYRRSAWAYLLARSPHMEVKRELLKHETEELLHDPRCGSDHYSLWIAHGKLVGLTEEQVNNAKLLPTTRAALNGWIYLAMYRPWYESLGGVAVLERTNIDSIVPGGAHQTRAERRWIEDLGVTAEQLPNFRVHREADIDHQSDIMNMLAKYISSESQWEGIVDASEESYDYWQVFLGGIAEAMVEVV